MGHLNTAWRHIRRSPYQAFAAILIILQTFFVISIFTFIIVGSTKIINYFESAPQVIAFFKQEATSEEINELKNEIEESGKVSKTTYVSKGEALKRYQNMFKNDQLLLDLVTADILPPSLEISTYEIADLSSISNMLASSPIVEEVSFQKDVVARLTEWTNAIRKIGIALVAVLALDSILIMMIIIGIKISQKREEIEIMRLIGASSWYIRWPFIIEGIFYGVIGAFIGWAVASAILWYATPFLESFLSGIPILPVSPIFLLEVLAGELILAFILGMFSSFMAVLRYLK